MNNRTGKIILILTIPLTLLVAIASCIGMFTAGFYAKETLNWQVQSSGQDMINLFLIVPSMLVTAIFAWRKNSTATLLWAGVVLYTVYTFTIYCFAVHFNRLFIIYCFTLGLSFYSFLWLLYVQVKTGTEKNRGKTLATRITGIYFLIMAGVFSMLWLAEIVPAIAGNSVPKSLKETGLLTNPVHVIDLSVFLPGIFLTGLLLLSRKPPGHPLAIILLAFFILMDITIGWLAFLMKQKDISTDLSVIIVMSVLALISLTILISQSKNYEWTK